MNERIREIAHEAGLPTYNPAGIPTKLEKFAELIVKECCSIADEVERADTGMFASKYIRAHFGVEP